ncbi:hypothetical protein H4CHR_05172 [Variovorax sp. PBS-H4]|uniref:DUF2946 family protein n=1 Tax=Variovorax sp. PBS-H4 TaxID=434008 RepID=UPI001318FE27|nr:DUF2946 family protein [Variovorax sp. PBS-H4]VTU40452.1 hypothetical protein H4CHR_05172 [Variovorax sp. PBS-H4]
MVRLRAFLLWLMMLAVPFQGYAAVAMAFCSPATAQSTVGASYDHSRHDHASPGGDHHHAVDASHDGPDHHAQSMQDDESGAFHKCGNCAACHSVGMTPTVAVVILHGLPQALLAEPFRAMATVSPRVPHRPPRA